MASWSGVQVKEGGANKWNSADVFYLRKYFTLHTPIFEKSIALGDLGFKRGPRWSYIENVLNLPSREKNV